jgi:hypothetical protein
MFGHHSLSETSFATDAIDLFFNPTGVSGTGSTFSSDYTVNTSSNIFVLGTEGFTGTGTAPVLGADGLEITSSKIELAIAELAVENQAAANASLAAASVAGNVLFQSQASDDLIENLGSVLSFSETDSISDIAAQNTANRSLFGALVASLNGAGIQTTNVGVQGTMEIGRVLVWGNLEITQDPSYSEIVPSQTPSFSNVTPSQTPSFSNVTPSQTPSYSSVTPSHSPSWDQQEA